MKKIGEDIWLAEEHEVPHDVKDKLKKDVEKFKKKFEWASSDAKLTEGN